MACCMAVSMAGAAGAADVDGSVSGTDADDGRIWLVETGGSTRRDTSDSGRETPGNSRGYSYEIKIHYEQPSGQNKVESVKGKAAAGADIPWRDELQAVREYNGKYYVLSGVVGNQDMSEKASDNVVNVYYRLDADDNGTPDKLERDGKKADFKLVSVFTDADSGRVITIEDSLKDKAWGELAAESFDTLRDVEDVTYRLVRVEAPSIFVTGEASKNTLKLIYEVDEISQSSKPAKPADDDFLIDGKCPINGQPGWLCEGTHNHAKMLAEQKAAESKPVVNPESDILNDGEAKDPATWCTVHDQPAWVCTGQHS